MRNQPHHSRGNKRKAYDNIVFGRQPVIELLQAAKPIDKILLQLGAFGEPVNDIRKLAKEKEVPVKTVPEEKLNTITGGNHQGVVAFTSAVEFQKIENILPLIIEKGETPLLLLLDGITDVRNFG
ncbi:MAG TPA: RNA methyltransferase substrate-binding domain-containing protein, partial [Chitinophagales bacterium]|nr:RNA methyltransferase substrate-binding domain-containing protein [Chitinophagales bacterium]